MAIHVLLYLKGTMTYGLPLGGRGAGTLNAYMYVDTAFANDQLQEDFRSVSGYLGVLWELSHKLGFKEAEVCNSLNHRS